MRNPEDFCVRPDQSLREAMAAIDRYGLRIVFVAEGEGAGRKLVGCLSDGDVRRFLLGGGSLEALVREAMNPHPLTGDVDAGPEEWRGLLCEKNITVLPLMAGDALVKIYYQHPVPDELPEPLDIPVVIQAGGKGTRLRPYTDVLPKPLIPVAGKTITEHIMDRCLAQGCTHFEMIINYRKELIRAYFTDRENPYDVHFIEETEFLGTAGGLRLVLPHVGERFFVHNCDILLKLDFHDFVRFHREGGYILSTVGAEVRLSVPYGCIESDARGTILSLEEKPELPFVANTGLYLVERRFLDLIEEGEHVDITTAMERAMAQGERVGVYHVPEEAWLDMGQPEALEEMQRRLSLGDF